MEKPPMYSVNPIEELSLRKKEFLIYNDRQLPMQVEQELGFVVLPKRAANFLVQDVNEILLRDFIVDEGGPQKSFSYSDVSKHRNFSRIREQQERMSLIVCVNRIYSDMQDKPSFRLELDKVIQWDSLYRMSPGPLEKMEQMQAVYPAIEWLGSDWADLQGNYATTIQEMEELEVPFVSQTLIDRLKVELDDMTIWEMVAVWYLYEFFHRFSISLPILWVRGVIRSNTLEDAYHVFTSDNSLTKVKKAGKEEGDFMQRRLGFLRKFLKAMR